MAKYRESNTAVRWYARLPVSAFREEGLSPDDFPNFCEVLGTEVDVNLSRAGKDCAVRMPRTVQDNYIVRALPFANANKTSRRRGGPYRIWSTDFALLERRLTDAEITQWLKENGIKIDSYDHGTIEVPPNPRFWEP